MGGRADYCVYWFRLAHDHLKKNSRAGLVGTNTIRQNYSREGGLDYIVEHEGTITDAVSSMIWSGEAVVHVSVVNWIKGQSSGKKRLRLQTGNIPDEGWTQQDLDRIGPSLSFATDVTSARRLNVNAKQGGCYQGQTHGHDGFLLPPPKAKALIKEDSDYAQVVFPFLTADDLIGQVDAKPTRYVIDFHPRDLIECKEFPKVFSQIEAKVLPDRKTAAKEEEKRNAPVLKADPEAHVNHHHANFLKHWWLMSYPRSDMIEAISKLDRYLVCGQVTKRPIFEFISTKIRPNAALNVFAHDDDYSFGILQSGIHWQWFIERCSTLKSDFRYTSNTVFDTFPWPQEPDPKALRKVADAAVALRKLRSSLRSKYSLSFRELYRTLDEPGEHALKKAHTKLDEAVRAAYGMPEDAEPLRFLLELNLELANREEKNKKVTQPGLPSSVKNYKHFVTSDCVSV